ncbi:hypothetical protein PSJ8397_03404 [Pseudooctadecabacter jejudonensis]|uniref:Transposase n=1 Tax=Pseudooctadecabacter jejudonensis TaxID=1391910 RepID=A0A1Y5TIW8_9RHOB|nr:hypothetical protein PSJ8397_03404 [Pseudooctadecabacter jejudonensis]
MSLLVALVKEARMSKHAIWGFTIEVGPSGRKIWPNKLKYEAARRIREDGLSPGEIAAEIGVHECLIRKWSVADRRSRGELISVQEPAFTELDLSRFDAAPLIAFTAIKETNYGTETDGRIPS